MEALFIFITKSTGLLVLFYCAYYFLLRKETFFSSSRWFLLAGLITSVVLPFMVYTKIVWVEPAPIPVATTELVSNVNFNANTISHLNYAPVSLSPIVQNEALEINWNYVLLAVYCIGFLGLIIKFLIDFYSLNSVLKGKEVQQEADFKFIDTNENIAPFSYFDYIVYNSSMFTASELENIIEHEKVHSDQNHTVDVLISRIFCVLFWFNPIIWLYKKAILQNLEFIADYEASKKISDKKAYQYTLLKITTHENCVAITNHFYQSLIKKRIVMLNKNQSKKRNYLKYYAVIPALVAFVFLFQIKIIAQEKEQKTAKEVAKKSGQTYTLKINKNTTDQELKEIAEKLKKEHNIEMLVSNIKRNSQNELTAIQVDINKGTKNAQSLHVDGDEPIKNCGIVITIGNKEDKKIVVYADSDTEEPVVVGNQITEEDEPNAPQEVATTIAPPTPPTPPVYPSGPLPKAPVVDMSKMPKAPVAPIDKKDKVAMAKFQKEMKEFEKKMEAFQPDMSAYEKQMEDVMSQREAIYEKEMAKYEVAMEKFNVDMDRFNQDTQQKFGMNLQDREALIKQRDIDKKQHEIDRKQHEADRKQHEKDARQKERDWRQHEKDLRESRKS